jgi:hypothetical protein
MSAEFADRVPASDILQVAGNAVASCGYYTISVRCSKTVFDDVKLLKRTSKTQPLTSVEYSGRVPVRASAFLVRSIVPNILNLSIL